MDLSIGAIVGQMTAPVLDAASLVRTAGVDEIASFLRAYPDQRGTIETALATSGRIGDLSSIVERATTTVTGTASTLTGGGLPADGLVQRTAAVATETAGRLGDSLVTIGGALGAPVGQGGRDPLGLAIPTVSPSATGGQAAAALLGRAGDIVPGVALQAPVTDARAQPTMIGGSAVAARLTALTAEAINASLREGRLAELIGTAMRDGRVADLLAAARGGGLLPAVTTAARPLEGALAALATSRGGLSATELALFARAGLLSPADLKALHAAGIPVGVDAEEPVQTLVAPRDGPAEERFRKDDPAIDRVVIAGAGDPALTAFDAGAIRFASRSAVDIYGVLGPPGGVVVAADAFEGLLRAAAGDRATVERALGLDADRLARPDTLIALIERPALTGLRLADWRPGQVAAGHADLGPGTRYRELTLTTAASLFTLGEPRVAEARPGVGEIARGEWWRIVREGDDYLLCHLSAALDGREQRLPVREREARALMAGQVAVEHLIPAAAPQPLWSSSTKALNDGASGSVPQSALQNTTGGWS